MNLSMDLSLQQKLSPQMIQSLKLLQVSTLQLEQMIKQELETNPVLEETLEEDMVQEEPEEKEPEKDADEAGEVDDELPEDGDLQVEDDEIDWEEYLDDGFDLGYSKSEEAPENSFERVCVAEKSMEDHLTTQLSELGLEEKLSGIVRYLIGSLDPSGFVSYPLEEVAEYLSVNLFEVEEALAIVQRFEPPGIGARNLKECLQIQLKAKKMFDGLEMDIVTKCFEQLEKLKINEIANKLGKPHAEIQEAVRNIGTLDPHPGKSIGNEHAQPIVPDLIVEKISDQFVVYLNDGSLPRLYINPMYANMIKRKEKTDPKIKTFIRDKMAAGNWLIKAIEQRKTTMLKVMNSIVELQYEFFEKGPAFIKPLVLQTVAEMIEMHISTVSRVTNGKYVQTPHGVYELKYFFTSAVEQEDGSEISATSATNAIQELIENEDKKKPLSDQKIVELLKEKNIDIARRTVAKYRDRLKILPARLRKQF